MAQESVQQEGPLRGGRQRANHIQVHRIELGLKERKMVEQAFLGAVLPTTISVVAGGLGIGLAGYAVYQFFKGAPFDDLLPVRTLTDEERSDYLSWILSPWDWKMPWEGLDPQ